MSSERTPRVRPAGEGGGAVGDAPAEDRSAAAVVVRRMTEFDLAEVMVIERAVFANPWTLATFAGLLRRENTRLWVAEAAATTDSAGSGEVAGSVLGYAAVWIVADQAELGDIAVKEGWRRRGIGSRLLETVIGAMAEPGVRELFLEVRASNESAQRLYAAYGFEAVGRRSGYYTRPKEDALVLRCSIPPEPD